MNYKVKIHKGLPHAVSDIRPGRCVGNTTRQVNDTIDLLFSLPQGKKHVGFEDHSVSEHGFKANDHFRKMVAGRLHIEGRCRVVANLDYDSKVRQVVVKEHYIKANF